MNEREEMEADKKDKAAKRAEALSEALRLLPIAESWGVFAVMPDGSPAIMVSCPRYADAICIAQIGGQAMKKHIGMFHETPNQEI
jgi:hypothetical protein